MFVRLGCISLLGTSTLAYLKIVNYGQKNVL
jgi:hypothetical protein